MDTHIPEHHRHHHVVVVSAIIQRKLIIETIEIWLQERANDDEAFLPVAGDLFERLSHIADTVQGIDREDVVRIVRLLEVFPLRVDRFHIREAFSLQGDRELAEHGW